MNHVEIDGIVHGAGPVQMIQQAPYMTTRCLLLAYRLHLGTTWVLCTNVRTSIADLTCLTCIAEENHDRSQDQGEGEEGP